MCRHPHHATDDAGAAAPHRRQILQLTAASVSVAATASLAGRASAAPLDWSVNDMPSQVGRRVLITGGNGYPREGRSGLGYHTALERARKGADVIIASRKADRGDEAVRLIRTEVPEARIRFERLDLTDLAQVKAFADAMSQAGEPLDVLINNAGVMGRREREVTRDGHERVFGTNVIGPYVLTAGLLPLLRRSGSARVVWVASARVGALDFDNLQYERDYDYGGAYNRSKLGVLLMALEMQRRSQARGWGVASLACHHGVARTVLVPDGPGMDSPEGLRQRAAGRMFRSAAEGCHSHLYSATAAEVVGGNYYGPGGFSGPPGQVNLPDIALDEPAAARLWSALEEIGGVSFI